MAEFDSLMNMNEEQLIAEIFEFRTSLGNESDRGCALIAGANLEAELGRLFCAAFVEDKKVAKELFSHNGALGTFSSRIDLAYMMGYIGKKTHRDLHLIRKIRNTFAHQSKPLNFTDSSISDQCREFFHTTTSNESPRQIFIDVIMTTHAAIRVRSLRVNRASSGKDIPDEILNQMREFRVVLEGELKNL